MVATFPDGVVNWMDLGWIRRGAPAEYLKIVAWAGYGDDAILYAREHELAHHLLAEALGQPHCLLLHAYADPQDRVPLDQGTPQAKDEEHLANRLQRLSRTGVGDEFGRLEWLIPEPRLGELVLRLRALSRAAALADL